MLCPTILRLRWPNTKSTWNWPPRSASPMLIQIKCERALLHWRTSKNGTKSQHGQVFGSDLFSTPQRKRCESQEKRLAGYTTTLQTCHVSMIQAANAAAKAEKKLGIVLGGYQARSTALAKRITEAFTVLQKTNIDLRSFSRLRINESATGPSRVENLKEEVNDLEKRAKELQEKYGQLELERRSSDNRIATLEEKAMLEAEA